VEGNNKLSYFFLGMGIGVAIGILFAPKSGEETRRLIKEKADEGKGYVKRRSEEARESASELVERGKEAVGRQKDQLSAAVEAGKQAYREAVGASPAGKGAEPEAS
jgi:gas vesicle protein